MVAEEPGSSARPTPFHQLFQLLGMYQLCRWQNQQQRQPRPRRTPIDRHRPGELQLNQDREMVALPHFRHDPGVPHKWQSGVIRQHKVNT